MKAILLLLALSFFCFESKAQSYLLEKSQNATYLTGMLGKDDAVHHKGMTIGHSANGRLDLALSAEYGNGTGWSTFYAITPSIGYLVIKQGKIPFSLGLSTGYEVKRFTDSDLLRHNTIRGGIALYHQFRISKNISIIPGAFAGIDYKTRLLDTVYRDHVKTHPIGIQNTFLFKRFSITPAFSHSTDGKFLSIKLGLLFPRSESIQPLD